MKRSILFLVCLAVTVMVQAQIVSMYSEVYKENTGALEYKSWVSSNGNSRQETPDGKITIIRIDTMEMYNLDPVTKTAMVLPLSASEQMRGQRRQERLINANVNVEGFVCNHYEIVQSLPDGSNVTDSHEEWIYAPYNTWIRIFFDPLLGANVRRNIRTGPQPASLFEIPRDYTVTANPLGGLLDILKGAPPATR